MLVTDLDPISINQFAWYSIYIYVYNRQTAGHVVASVLKNIPYYSVHSCTQPRKQCNKSNSQLSKILPYSGNSSSIIF